jgi:glycosyltransferase involved in cell wall biosynthesis
VVVGDEIAKWYRTTYGLSNVHIVKNVPYCQRGKLNRTSRLREFAGVGDSDILFLYQGLLDQGRGINLLLNAFRDAPQDRHIVFMGYGALVESAKAFAQQYPNIHFHPAVPPEDLPEYTSSADVGLSIIENVSLSYYYCVPNKIFEYLTCGVPMIVSDFPEMAALVDTEKCGWKVSVLQREITRIVSSISRLQIEEKRLATLTSRTTFGWENEEKTLLAVYRSLNIHRSATAA